MKISWYWYQYNDIDIKILTYLYRGEDCMKKFCNSLRENAGNVINFEKNKMLPLTKKS